MAPSLLAVRKHSLRIIEWGDVPILPASHLNFRKISVMFYDFEERSAIFHTNFQFFISSFFWSPLFCFRTQNKMERGTLVPISVGCEIGPIIEALLSTKVLSYHLYQLF